MSLPLERWEREERERERARRDVSGPDDEAAPRPWSILDELYEDEPRIESSAGWEWQEGRERLR